MLTGEVTGFGFDDSGPTTDTYDFRFTATGGQLLTGGPLSLGGTWGPFFTGKDIGITLTSDSSDFAGLFTVDFSGDAAGTIGSIDPLSGGAIPEPSSFALSLMGLLSFGMIGRRRRTH